jgi:diguanylate cyclase (GGDEF)-like protein
MAPSAALLFGAGAMFAFLGLILPHPAGSNETGVVIVAIVASVSAIVLALTPGRIWPEWPFQPIMAMGTLLVSLAMYFWRPGEVASAVAMLYVWILLYAFYFFSTRAAIAQTVLVAVSYAVVLAAQGGHRSAVTAWIVTVGTAVIAGGLIGWLVHQVQEAAGKDALTGLPNRRTWEEALGRELARSRRTRLRIAIALADIDNFKDVNDSGGHHAGDLLLQDLANAWRLGLRSPDMLSRYGGDEFAMLLTDCGPEAAEQAVARLKAAFPARACTVGIACWDGCETADQLVGRADRAMYAGKDAGRNRVVLDRAGL